MAASLQGDPFTAACPPSHTVLVSTPSCGSSGPGGENSTRPGPAHEVLHYSLFFAMPCLNESLQMTKFEGGISFPLEPTDRIHYLLSDKGKTSLYFL